MKKTIAYEIKREIDTVEINSDLVAFADKTYRNGELIDEVQGITTKEKIEKVENDELVDKYKDHIKKDKKISIGLFDIGIKEAVRTVLFGSDEAVEEYNKYKIENPYSYIKENGMDEKVSLFYLSYYDHNLYDEKFIIQPKAMMFDYIHSRVNNYEYDLEKVAEKLKERKDVKFYNEKKYGEKEVDNSKPQIKKIPYYNREDECDECIEFLWIPTDEDFAKVREDVKDTFRRYDSVCEKIFGFEKLKREESAE